MPGKPDDSTAVDFERPSLPDKEDFNKFLLPPSVNLKPPTKQPPGETLPEGQHEPKELPVREGYVLKYSLELNGPSSREPFFRVTLVDSAPGAPTTTELTSADEFILLRNVGISVDKVGTEYLTVTYGNVEQAIVATFKDALIHGKKVSVIYEAYKPPLSFSQYVNKDKKGKPELLKRIERVEINR